MKTVMDKEGRLSGRDAFLVRAAPELFDVLTEIVEAYELGFERPELILKARKVLRKAMGSQ